MDKLNVLIVDDSIVFRKIFSQAVELTEIATAAQTASNGEIALERLANGNFDVVLLDVNMPVMDGPETLKRIREAHKDIAVIMISDAFGRDAKIIIDALSNGAMDFLMKPRGEDYDKNMKAISSQLRIVFSQVRMSLIGKRNITTPPTVIKGNSPSVQLVQPTQLRQFTKPKLSSIDLLLIASSTGGPAALGRVMEGIKENFNKPILIVQHMPPEFTKVLAESLDKKCKVRVYEGKEGDLISNGKAILAAGGYHMIANKVDDHYKTIKLESSDYVNGVRPAADVLFKSVAKEYEGAKILAVILTGMGNDGTNGVLELKSKCNCYCMAQSEKTCVVYGMPRSVVEANLCDEVVDLDNIAMRIDEISRRGVD